MGRALLQRGSERELVGVARGERPEWAGDVDWVPLDLTGDLGALPRDIDAIVHLAQSPRDRDFPEGAMDVFEVAFGATARLLDFARGAGVRRFVLASTATVYRPSPEPLREDSSLECSSHYAACKRGAELLLGAYSELLSGLALRLFTVYGPGESDRLIWRLVEKVRSGEPVDLRGERGLLLSPIHVDDVAAAVLAAVDAPGDTGFEVLNVGGAEALGIREIAEAIGGVVGREPRFETRDGGEPGGLVADLSRTRRVLGLSEPRPFRSGVEAMLAEDRDRVRG